jgi:hypothetical protein
VSVPSSALGPPTPSHASECVYPLGPKGGRSNTHLRVREWGDPIRTIGKKALHSVYSLCVSVSLSHFLCTPLPKCLHRLAVGLGLSLIPVPVLSNGRIVSSGPPSPTQSQRMMCSVEYLCRLDPRLDFRLMIQERPPEAGI